MESSFFAGISLAIRNGIAYIGFHGMVRRLKRYKIFKSWKPEVTPVRINDMESVDTEPVAGVPGNVPGKERSKRGGQALWRRTMVSRLLSGSEQRGL